MPSPVPSPSPMPHGGTPPWSACASEVPTPGATGPGMKKLPSVEIVEDTLRDAESYHPDNQQGLEGYQSPTGLGDGDATPYYPRGTVEGGPPNDESSHEKSVKPDPQKTDMPENEEVPKPTETHDPQGTAMPENEGIPKPTEIQNDDEVSELEGVVPPKMLSEAAAAARLRRVCQPNSKGEYKVPPEVVSKYKDIQEGRMDLMKLFEKVGHSPDRASANT